MVNREEMIADIAKAVMARLRVDLPAAKEADRAAPQTPTAPPRASAVDGVFETVDEAVAGPQDDLEGFFMDVVRS